VLPDAPALDVLPDAPPLAELPAAPLPATPLVVPVSEPELEHAASPIVSEDKAHSSSKRRCIEAMPLVGDVPIAGLIYRNRLRDWALKLTRAAR
jgi:hypothetical protein